jgi:uncharacterized protein YbjT (DUF2867 family)
MKILLTGATGYIGKRLLPLLLEAGHEVIACVRDAGRFEEKDRWDERLEVWEVDFSEPVDLAKAPKDIDAAYYLMHSMTASIGNFETLEARVAHHFSKFIEETSASQIIYLTGIISQEEQLSPHLESRLEVENILSAGKVPLTALRAGIVVGSGSASFEIIRDLTEKLPVMVAPRWLNSKCQPIAIRNVLDFLTGVLGREDCKDEVFDISCGETLTYKEMLLIYAKVRKLRRWIFTLPIMTPRLSSYWLYFITSTTYNLAVNLVDSMKIDVLGKDNRLAEKLGVELISYENAVRLAFTRIEQNAVVSSWKDSFVSTLDRQSLYDYIQVPKYGVFTDKKSLPIIHNTEEGVLENIWSIGGERGWYYGQILWKLRGYLDKLVGGVGLRRGRTHRNEIYPGDALDFWRVLVADREKKRLLLYAEMKLPGDAWLEFKVVEENGKAILKQTATFRPDGIMGRLYWYSVLPFHFFVFGGMIRNLERYREEPAVTKLAEE